MNKTQWFGTIVYRLVSRQISASIAMLATRQRFIGCSIYGSQCCCEQAGSGGTRGCQCKGGCDLHCNPPRPTGWNCVDRWGSGANRPRSTFFRKATRGGDVYESDGVTGWLKDTDGVAHATWRMDDQHPCGTRFCAEFCDWVKGGPEPIW